MLETISNQSKIAGVGMAGTFDLGFVQRAGQP
jgi:hypothetical protein